jgi:fatty acid desaturase
LIWPLNSLAVVALALGWPSSHWAVQSVLTALAAYTFLCFTSCFHETSHQTVCSSRSFSVWLGRIIGTMILVPYTTYRESHIRHHAYLNKPSDWELWPYSDPNTSLWFRRIFCWLEFPLGFLTTPFAYGRLYFHKQGPLTDPKIRRTIGFEYLAMAATWTTLLGVVAWGGWWIPFLRAWVVPHWIASVLQTFRKFTEHLGMKSYDPLLGARTVMGPSLWTRIACYFNFDIFLHGPHHRHPRASTHELCGKMTDYQRSNPKVEYPVFSTYRAAIRHMLPAILNPGVGMNVGAPAPDDEKQQVTNFVADVAEEVLSESDCVTQSRAAC